MTLTQLRYFNTVCLYKNVTKAADELHVSQPSVSNAIRELETELGIQLFYRIKMRLTLTQEGEFFRKESSSILSSIDLLVQQMRDLGGKRNLVRIGIPPMIGTILFPQMLINFRKFNPNVRVEIREFGSLSCQELVVDESLDLAIVITNDIDTGKLNHLPVMETVMLFCISDKHPLADKASVCVEDFKDEPLVLLPDGSYNRAQAELLYQKKGLTPNVLLHSSQLYTVERLLQNGAAAAFLFKDLVSRISGVVGIPIDPPIEPIHVGLIWKRDKHLYADATDFIQFAKDYKPIL